MALDIFQSHFSELNETWQNASQRMPFLCENYIGWSVAPFKPLPPFHLHLALFQVCILEVWFGRAMPGYEIKIVDCACPYIARVQHVAMLLAGVPATSIEIKQSIISHLVWGWAAGVAFPLN